MKNKFIWSATFLVNHAYGIDSDVMEKDIHTHKRARMADELESCDGKMFIFVIYSLRHTPKWSERERERTREVGN